MNPKKSPPFSKRTEDWSSEPNPLSTKLCQLRAAGREIFDLTVSNPTRCGFDFSSKFYELHHPKNIAYEPDACGLLEARRAICRYYKMRHGANVTENQIFITANTSEAYSFVFRLLADPGDKIMAPKPSYPLLHYLAQLHDLQLEFYGSPKKIENTAGARAILLVHPNNPTGNYVSDLAQTSLPLIADEVFLDYTFGLKPKTFTDYDQTLCFTLSGISKILGLPQMKISWIVVSGPEKLRSEAMRKLEIIADTYLSAGTPAQNALPGWLEKTDEIQNEIRSRTSKNALYAVEKFKNSKVKALMPEGGWSMVLKMPGTKSDEEWALFLLEQKGVLAHPGFLFDFEEDSVLVVSLLVKEEIFRTGIERILETI